MRQETARADLVRQAAQVRIGPGGQHIVIEPRYLALAIPGQAEPVAIGLGLGLHGVQALTHQRLLRGRDDLFQVDRLADIGGPAAHGVS